MTLQKTEQRFSVSPRPDYAVLDLFSGIGGFSLGLTRAGFRTVAFCEIEEYPRSILRKHWPNVPIFEDVRTLHAKDLPETVDVICGGYPCQPFSLAGKRSGAKDDRHLWPEIVRIIRELDATTGKPTWCTFENVAGHVSMGLDQVLSDLEGEGYEATAFIIPACAVNAPHRRDRVWIVALANRERTRSKMGMPCNEARRTGENRPTCLRQTHWQACTSRVEPASDDVANPSRELLDRRRNAWSARRNELTNSSYPSAHAGTKHGDIPGFRTGQIPQQQEARVWENIIANSDSARQQERDVATITGEQGYFAGTDFERITRDEWITLPGVRARNDGISGRVARLKALGNAVVPQIPELIGRCIMAV